MKTPSIDREIQPRSVSQLSRIGRIALLAALFSSVLVRFVSFSPTMPQAGLDPSWMFAVNEAVARRLSFGRDLVWVHGPYASVYTHAYHPATYAMVVVAGVFLAIAYWACLVTLMKSRWWVWIVAFGVALAGLSGDPDPLLFTLPLLVGLVTHQALFGDEARWVGGKFAPLYVAALFAPLGLLPLIKGSLLPLCAAISVVCAVLFIAKRRPWLAAICVLSPALALAFFWAVSGQPIEQLISYFSATAELTAGWAQGMGYSPSNAGRGAVYLHLELASYVVAAVALLALILSRRRVAYASRLTVAALFALILFLAFKAGFVIHDEHALIAGETVLLTVVLFSSQVKFGRTVATVLVLAFVAYLLPEVHYAYLLGRGLPGTGYVAAWQGISRQLTDPGWMQRDFEAATRSLRDEAGFPMLQGRADIYSYDQSYLIASGNEWSPRPVLQSHTAYTPALAEKDRRYLAGDASPDNIFFAVQPIFGRLPSLEDGPSWPLLVSDYQPLGVYGNHLALRRNARAEGPPRLSKTPLETHKLGETVPVPAGAGLLFAQVNIEPTILGRISNTLYKPAELEIELRLADGTRRRYRLIAGMARAGFLLSPLVEDTSDFGRLFGGASELDTQRVTSMVIGRAPLNSRIQTADWREDYTVTFGTLDTSH